MIRNFTFDARINTTIAVQAFSEDVARQKALVIYNNLELVDPLNNINYDLDLEDGLKPME